MADGGKDAMERALKRFEEQQAQKKANRGPSTGLCDSHGVELYVGDIVRKPVDANTEVHGDWALYRIVQQGLTPLLLYVRSEKGQVLPEGYTGCVLADLYNPKMFCFATDPLSLRPVDDIFLED